MNRKPYRHGDLLLVPIASIPAGATEVNRDQHGRLVLLEGEATGHAHAILDQGASLYKLVDPADVEEMRRRFLSVTDAVTVVHEEHHPLTPELGAWEVIRQVEYEPERLRAVAD